MDKFLNFSFKFGKVFTVVLLVALLLSMLCSGINAIKSFKSVNLEIPTFTEIANNARAFQSNTVEQKDNNVEPYILAINEIAKDLDLNTYGKNIILGSLNDVNEEYKLNYSLGLKQFLSEYYGFMKAQNKPSVSGEQLATVLNDYKFYFQRNVSDKEAKELKLQSDRILSLSIFVSSLLLFILCLLLPLLIKIEENTRK
jgi:hypothetical protein